MLGFAGVRGLEYYMFAWMGVSVYVINVISAACTMLLQGSEKRHVVCPLDTPLPLVWEIWMHTTSCARLQCFHVPTR